MQEIDRYIRWNTSPICHVGCSYCPAIGALSRTYVDWERAIADIAKLKRTHRREVQLSCNFMFHPLGLNILKSLQENGLRPIIQINSRVGREQMRGAKELVSQTGCEINYVLDDCERSDLDGIYFLETHGESVYYTIIARRTVDLASYLRRLPAFVLKKLHLYFPYKAKATDEYFTEDEIYRELSRLHSLFPDFHVVPQRGISVHEYGPQVEKHGRSIELRQLYRNTLNQELYRRNQWQMGEFPQIRRVVQWLAQPGWQRSFSWVFLPILGVIWSIVDFKCSSAFVRAHSLRGIHFLERRWIALENLVRDVFWFVYPFYRSVMGGLKRVLGKGLGILIDTRWFVGRGASQIRKRILRGYWRSYHWAAESKGWGSAVAVACLVNLRRFVSLVVRIRISLQWGFYYVANQLIGDVRKIFVHGFWAIRRFVVFLQIQLIIGAWNVYGNARKFCVLSYWILFKCIAATYRLLWRASFPIRKVLYFVNYQFRKRVLGQGT